MLKLPLSTHRGTYNTTYGWNRPNVKAQCSLFTFFSYKHLNILRISDALIGINLLSTLYVNFGLYQSASYFNLSRKLRTVEEPLNTEELKTVWLGVGLLNTSK